MFFPKSAIHFWHEAWGQLAAFHPIEATMAKKRPSVNQTEGLGFQRFRDWSTAFIL
jgi:hypothetical protein